MQNPFWNSLLYLLPPAILALGLRSLSGRMYLFAFLNISGTLVHELSHLIAGLLLGAKPTSMNIWPRKTASGYIMGHVAFANIRWWNAAPVALAPLLIAPLLIGIAYWRVRDGWRFDPLVDGMLWIAIAPQLLCCWPSGTDWRLSLRSWPLFLLGLAAIAAVWTKHL
jgi:hypothetical protein